ncbi:MAG: type I restriction enzyme HsdR N-terminal domain-containing protein [Planctomycetaceae bacterium]|jgi:DNA modification methylase|nr:type I restriction enzyme HsdR N-terminal domain-containing protein [Planctomycetaceae bacterium]
MTRSAFFGNLDFNTIAHDPSFKESAVRSFIIDPLVKRLRYSAENIVLEKTVQIQTGSKKQTTPYYADYVLKIGNSFVCVIEAKAPEKHINDESIIDQAFSYASHREIRSNYFVLCNGLEFALYRTDLERTLLLHFHLAETDQYFDELKSYLAPERFYGTGQIIAEKSIANKNIFNDSTYCRQLLPDSIPIRRQAAQRHFGVHGYFTRQSWDIVQAYIKNYSKPGDTVLDPYGGSGVTVIESLMLGRKGIHIDINPLANFLVESLIAPVNLQDFEDGFEFVKQEYLKKEPKTRTEIKAALEKYPHPKKLPLPKGSDVKTTDKLFNSKQTAQLGLLKRIISKIKNENVRKSLLLMFSGIVTRNNSTFHSNSHRGGNAAAFMYYRYRISPRPDEIDIPTLLFLRYNAVLNAKKEMKNTITESTAANAQIIKGTATDLPFVQSESVDYIYTDPPYGKNIQYLDLSAMWYAWLDLDVSDEDYQLEAIEDGRCDKSKEEYKQLIAQSIREMFRVLKYDRWLSFVFAHKDPAFWHLIVDTAESCGFEYVGAVPQKNGSSNYHQRQHPFTVLTGQLIINFRKVKNPRTMLKWNLGIDIKDIIVQTVEGIIAEEGGATLERINNEIIGKALELGFLDMLTKEYTDITEFLKNYSYDKIKKVYYQPPNKPFKSHIPIELRIKYYLMSLLNRNERLGKESHFSEIVLEIIPSLRNGNTPDEQTILDVLEDIAERAGTDCWRLRKDGQQELKMNG